MAFSTQFQWFSLVEKWRKQSTFSLHFPRYSNHGLFNNSGGTVKGVFWAAPTNKLFDLFKAIHNVADPHEVVRISDAHDIHFQMPAGEARRSSA